MYGAFVSYVAYLKSKPYSPCVANFFKVMKYSIVIPEVEKHLVSG